MKKFCVLKYLCPLALVGFNAYAAPVVLHDSGNTESMENYTRVFSKPAKFVLPKDPQVIANIRNEIDRKIKAHGSANTVRIPIRTAGLQPGKFNSIDAYFPNLSLPIFVVGADPLSLEWLRKRRSTLAKVGAIGWVVQAESTADVRAIAEAGAGLRFIAFGGNNLQKLFGVSTYPVLISERSMEQ